MGAGDAVQEVMMRALSGEIHWFQAAAILGVDVRTMHRWRERFEHNGCHALFDWRRQMPSPRRAPAAVRLSKFISLPFTHR